MPLHLRNRLGGLAAVVLLAGVGLTATASAASAQPASAGSVTTFAGVFNPIKNVGNGKCLQPAGGSTALFEAIVQMPCNGSSAQGWQYARVGTNTYNFINQVSGLCMWAWDGAFDGGRVLQSLCNRSSNAQFKTNAALPNVVVLQSRVGFRDTGFCVDVPSASSADGLGMQMYRCNGTLAQRWVVGFA